MQGRLKCCQILLAASASMSARDASGATASMRATQAEQFETLELLVLSGDDIKQHRDLQQRTVLHAAVDAEHQHEKLCNLLLEHGCCPDVADSSGVTPLHLAISKSRHVATLFSSDCCAYLTHRVVQALLDQLLEVSSVGVHQRDDAGNTLLHHAVLQSQV